MNTHALANSLSRRDAAAVLHPYTNAVANEADGPLVITRGDGMAAGPDPGRRVIPPGQASRDARQQDHRNHGNDDDQNTQGHLTAAPRRQVPGRRGHRTRVVHRWQHRRARWPCHSAPAAERSGAFDGVAAISAVQGFNSEIQAARDGLASRKFLSIR